MFVASIILLIVGIVSIFIIGAVTVRSEDGTTIKKKARVMAPIGIIAAAAICFVLSLFYMVNPGEVGIEVFFGKVVNFASAGLQSKNPLSQVITLNLRTQKYELKLEGASKDLQEIGVDIAINYRLDYEKISDLYNKVGTDYEIKVVNPATQNIVKAGISQFPIADIIVRRNDLTKSIFDSLKERLDSYYIVLETVNLNNISFSPEFTKAVTEKQVQEQGVQTAEYKRQQAEKDKQATILAAEAEAEKQRLLRVNTSKEVIELKWIEKWDGKLPTYITGESTIPMVNFSK
jgi:regulator of protease activity HflC (stomatin/prohibitin superfamily)